MQGLDGVVSLRDMRQQPRPVGTCQRSDLVELLDLHFNDAGETSENLAITMTSNSGDDDPFRDPSLASAAPQPPPSAHAGDVPATLAVGRNASLTLGTDSLIVLGKRGGLSQMADANNEETKIW
jgi:hypothetical protein